MSKSSSLIMAKRLKELREEKKLSHVSLSKALKERYDIDISRDSLMCYEVSDPHHTKAYKNEGMRVEYLRCLADFYGVSSDYLLGFTNDPHRKPAAADELGLSSKAIKIISSVHEMLYRKMILRGLNALLESEDFLEIAAEIVQYSNKITNEIHRIEQEAPKVGNPFYGKRTELAFLDRMKSNSLEKEISSKYPELKGRISVLCGDESIGFMRLNIENHFGEIVNKLSGYEELQKIKQEIGDDCVND